ncbi:MAG TPA: ATP-binding protein [Gemmatimonadales bacterium]|nr:ATP-binding protein [Gemmatimonadales bacterium]
MTSDRALRRVRWRLTLWYAGVFTAILVLLGGGLFLAVRRQMSRQLDLSLQAATEALTRAARIREVERAHATGTVMDAVDELHIPDRLLFLFDSAGRPLKPDSAPSWTRTAALEAVVRGRVDRDIDAPNDHDVRLHAERFSTAQTSYIAIAVADRLELEDQFATLIEAFTAAAFVAILLVGGGGYLLVRQSTAPIERSMDQMRRFMADAAHELRTPITIVRTRAELALGAPREPGTDAAAFQAIEREAGRLGSIVGDLLTLARAESGDRPIAREPLYLDDAAMNAVEAARALADHKGVKLEVGAFEEARIAGDAALLRQLFLIVLDNAIKFTPPGGQVRLDVAATDGHAEVVVADTGIGIPVEQVPHIFERFYRGDPARQQAEGAGLGLAIARWIADAHGADIAIQSAPGAGTRVSIRFALAS